MNNSLAARVNQVINDLKVKNAFVVKTRSITLHTQPINRKLSEH